MNTPEPAPNVGVLNRTIWRRTIRSLLASLFLSLLRARSTRLSIESLVSGFALPPKIASLITLTVNRTGLWLSERTDIARELHAHFADGLDAGQSPDKLGAAFGDPARTAKLMRRAKLRSRPLWWRTLAYTVRGTLAAILFAIIIYATLAARYYLGRPKISRNYTAEMNAAILAIPEEQRAWPVYIQAVRELGPTPAFISAGISWPSHAGDPGWNDALAHLAAHPNALPLIRKAAAMPTLGFVYRANSDPDFMRALEVRNPDYKFDPSMETQNENPPLIGVLLPYAGEFWKMTRILVFDIAAAADAGDHARVVEDLDAILGMANQCIRAHFLIDTQVAVGLGNAACKSALEHIGMLTDDERTHVAHRFAMLAGGRIRFDPDRERVMFQDLLQRYFTDDGLGDGHMVAAEVERFRTDFGVDAPHGNLFINAALPIRSAMGPSRAELTKVHDRIMANFRTDEALPLWRDDERSNGRSLSDIYAKSLSLVFPFESFGNRQETFSHMLVQRDLFEARRAAVFAACALETYRRRHGRYPEDLARLVPELLPSMPLDPFDGKPMRYRVDREGAAAALYSVGVDQIDDGGTTPPDAKIRENVINTRMLGTFRKMSAQPLEPHPELDAYRGDWVMYPPPPASPSEIRIQKERARP